MAAAFEAAGLGDARISIEIIELGMLKAVKDMVALMLPAALAIRQGEPFGDVDCAECGYVGTGRAPDGWVEQTAEIERRVSDMCSEDVSEHQATAAVMDALGDEPPSMCPICVDGEPLREGDAQIVMCAETLSPFYG